MHGGHGHTHDGSEGPGHTHGPPQPGPPPQIDELVKAALDEQFQQVPLAVSPDANDLAVCSKHSQEVCAECGLNFSELNVFAKLIAASNEIAIPPPPNVIHPSRSQAVQKTKEEGNVSRLRLGTSF